MKEDIALIIAATCIKSARDIGDLARLIPSERKDIKLGIASTVHKIYEDLIGVILKDFPQIKQDMERRLAEYDRMI